MDAGTEAAKTVNQTDVLPSLRFDADDHRPAERIDAMNEVYRGLFTCRRVNEASEAGDDRAGDPTLRLKAWSLGEIAATSFEMTQFIKEPTDRMAPQLSDMLIFSILHKGQFDAECGDARMLVRPGPINLGQARYTLRKSDAAAGIALRLPIERVAYDESRYPRIISFRAEAWTGRLVKSAMQSLFQALPTMTRTEAKNAEPTLIALFRGLLNTGTLDDEAHTVVQSARSVAMKDYVLTHLRDEGLDAKRLQSAFGASRATVYRAFAEVGGVDRFIRDQRLEAVRRELRRVPPRRGIVRTVAERYGFWDQGAFCRAFRNLHGIRPSDVLGAHRFSQEETACETSSQSRRNVVSLASFWAANGAGETSAAAACS